MKLICEYPHQNPFGLFRAILLDVEGGIWGGVVAMAEANSFTRAAELATAEVDQEFIISDDARDQIMVEATLNTASA